MKKQWNKKIVSYFLCMMIVTIMALTGCNGNTEQNSPDANQQEQEKAQDKTSNDNTDNDNTDNDSKNDDVDDNKDADVDKVLGEGDTSFSFFVVNKEGEETSFEIHTEKETVGEALVELELIDGDKSEYGLYVKTVNGITLDFDKDGMYWAFYINDEYAETGVDSTKIVDGDKYSFRMQEI